MDKIYPIREIIASDELSSLFERFHSVGGAVDYILIDPGTHQPSEALHQIAAIVCMELLNDKDPSSRWCCDYDTSQMYAEPINISKFLGSYFDTDTHRIIRPKSYPDLGYAFAFSSPPYGLRVSLEEVNELFLAINTHLFNNFSDALDIYQWSTNWSNYFIAGNEWWGSFFWTIHNKSRDFIVVVGASETD
ncbi:MAG: hypothetical protein AAF485_20290 [Chloroflexota bacterium]